MNSNPQDANVATLQENSGEKVVAIHQDKLLVPVRNKECGERVAAWLRGNSHLTKCQLMLVHVADPQWTDVPQSGFQAMQMIQDYNLDLRCKQQMLLGVASMLQTAFPDIRVAYTIRHSTDKAGAITELAREWNADCIMVFAQPKRILPFLFDNRLTRNIMARADRTVQVIQKAEKPPQVTFPRLECSAY
jgi:hypothetical protein